MNVLAMKDILILLELINADPVIIVGIHYNRPMITTIASSTFIIVSSCTSKAILNLES